MVLRPVLSSSSPSPHAYAPAWPVIERAQRQITDEYWLISQPDHAALAGALAARFAEPGFPTVDPLMARAFEVHDSGWAIFDSEARLTAAPSLDRHGKPVSFLEIEPRDFLRAWMASIDRAECVCPAGGYVVSRHFSALGEARLASGIDDPRNAARLRDFVSQESQRQRRLEAASGQNAAELEDLLLLLQFSDLLSLYLCCGATQAVEFPQQFAAGKVRLRRENQAFVLQPTPFGCGVAADEVSVGIKARRYPARGNDVTTLAFVLW